ncbi:HD-GYP domain-containing protein [Brevibacillus agri]|uniref:HD-GYP domain-containing protein n=1 Tax=Brevibacillus agri TaxID=51101 RepID=UPI003D74F307
MNQRIASWLHKLWLHDSTTYHHSIRVSNMARRMAAELNLNQEQSQKLVLGCSLHDIGKIFVPKSILRKSSALSQNEWELIKQHPIWGNEFLQKEGITNHDVTSSVLYHHERLDGTGYPFGLIGSDIPFYARICSILDAFDCMVSDRPYRKSISFADAKTELWKSRNTQFDPYYLTVFLQMCESHFIELYHTHEC